MDQGRPPELAELSQRQTTKHPALPPHLALPEADVQGLGTREAADSTIVLSPEGRGRCGADLQTTRGRDREVHPEKGHVQIRDRVHMASQAPRVGLATEVEALEGYDAVVQTKAEVRRDPIRVQTGGVHEEATGSVPAVGPHPVPVPTPVGLPLGEHDPRVPGGVGERGHHRPWIHRRRGGAEDRPPHRLHARLDPARLGRGDDLHLHPILPSAALELVQPSVVGLGSRDHQLAAPPQGQATGFAPGRHSARPFHREPRLQAVLSVVEAGVEDAAVSTGGVRPTPILLEDRDRLIGKALPDRQRHRESQDTAPDDEHIRSHVRPTRSSTSPGSVPERRTSRYQSRARASSGRRTASLAVHTNGRSPAQARSSWSRCASSGA